MHTDVAVLIVTYNSSEQIAECLNSVLEQRKSVTQEIIIVDNASTDETVELIRRQFPMVKLVTPGKNLGFSAGVNLAASHANADYLLLLNPDTVILDHAIDVVVEFARRNPQHALYGGRTLKTDGSLEPSSCWGLPSLWSFAMFAFGLSTAAKRNPLLDPESLGGWQRDTVREVGIITGCFLLVERDAWQKLAGLDERYFMYGEDADFAMRAWRAGYRPVICPDARLIHEVGQSSATPLHKALLLYRGKASYVRTHWTGLRQSVGLALLKLGVALRAAAGAVTGSKNPTWRELWRQRAMWSAGYSNRSVTPLTATPQT